MNSEINLKSITKKGNRVVYDFCYSENLREYFTPTREFFIEYNGVNIDSVPDSILVIPFLCNVLPVVWLLDVTMHAAEIDKNFYESIPEFKNGYVNMYPMLNFAGKIIADKIVDNNKEKEERTSGKKLMFFSGGVDAFNTLISHSDEKPILMTLWGSDVFFDDIKGWNNVKNHVIKTAEQFSLEYKFIKSNFRKFLNEGSLTELVLEKAKDGWWHGFQHGIGLIGHAAPIAFAYNSKIVYIASTFTAKDAGKITCASDPTIDNYVKWANTNVIHDGYEFTRQDKIVNICNFVQKHQNIQIKLHVCWQSSGGQNCNQCEKCYRTIMGILAAGYDPNDYGLFYSKSHNNKIKDAVLYKVEIKAVRWQYIQEQFKKNPEVFIKHPELKWITKIDFEKINDNPLRCVWDLSKNIMNLAKRIVRKILRVFGLRR